MKKRWNKKSFILIFTAFIFAVCSIILPGILINRHYKEEINSVKKVPDKYFPTNSNYNVIKNSSQKLTDYQVRQLLSGVWESRISELSNDYWDKSGYLISQSAKEKLNNLYGIGFSPIYVNSDYNEWYNWDVKVLMALDTNLLTYAGIMNMTEFNHYIKDTKILVCQTDKDNLVMLEIYTKDDNVITGFNPYYPDGTIIALASIMLGPDYSISKIETANGLNEQLEDKIFNNAIYDYVTSKELKIENPDLSKLKVSKISVGSNASDHTRYDFYIYLYIDKNYYIAGLIPAE